MKNNRHHRGCSRSPCILARTSRSSLVSQNTTAASSVDCLTYPLLWQANTEATVSLIGDRPTKTLLETSLNTPDRIEQSLSRIWQTLHPHKSASEAAVGAMLSQQAKNLKMHLTIAQRSTQKGYGGSFQYVRKSRVPDGE